VDVRPRQRPADHEVRHDGDRARRGDGPQRRLPHHHLHGDGLTNGAQYTVKVQAENQLGLGPESAESAVMVPDVKPEQMAPTVDRGTGPTGGQLRITWPAADALRNDGTPIRQFQLQLVTGGQHGHDRHRQPTSENVYLWTGLTNGTTYQFTITAENNAGTSDPSEPSRQAKPPPTSPPLNVIAGRRHQQRGRPADRVVVAAGAVQRRRAVVLHGGPRAVGRQPRRRGGVADPGPEDHRRRAQRQHLLLRRDRRERGRRLAAGRHDRHGHGVRGAEGQRRAHGHRRQQPVTVAIGAATANGEPVDSWSVQRRDNSGTETRTVPGGAVLSYNWAYPNTTTMSRFRVAPMAKGKMGAYTDWSDDAHPHGPPGAVTITFTRARSIGGGTFAMEYAVAMGDKNGNLDSELELHVSSEAGAQPLGYTVSAAFAQATEDRSGPTRRSAATPWPGPPPRRRRCRWPGPSGPATPWCSR
jgi:hypothetical protein